MFRKIFVYIHKILGIPLSVIFVLWFLSGFAMIWSSFPRARAPHSCQPLSRNVLPVDSLLTLLSDSVRPLSMSLTRKYGRDCYKVTVGDSAVELFADSFQPVPAFSDSLRAVVLAQWCDAPVVRVDTLSDIDQWIPFGRWAERMPVYKYYFDDPDSHQLYMTREGDVIQFTSSSDRRMAWIGAIPHWIYFTSLRRHQELWTDFVIWSALLGCVMCVAGIVVAIMVWWRQRRVNGLWHCPYRKPWWRWHFILGLLFGWCAVTFAFSGYMSMADMPSFLKKERPEVTKDASKGPSGQKGEHKDRKRGRGGRRNRGVGMAAMAPTEAYLLPMSRIIAAGDSAVSITWKEWNGQPYYSVVYPSSSRNIDASTADEIRDFVLTAEMVGRDVAREIPDSTGWSVTLLDEYDADYYGRKTERVPLPVYKVTIDDYMHTVMYYNPTTLSVSRVDDDSRTRRFLYSGLHALNLKFLTDTPWLWYAVMLMLLTGGSLLSLTGLVLAWQWLVRTVRRLF